MHTRTQLFFTWCAPVAALVIIVAFWPVAGYLPPLRAASSAAEVAGFYRDHSAMIRLGLVVVLVACGFWGALVAVITTVMRGMRPQNMTLIYGAFASGVVAWVFLLMPVVVLAVTAFRPDRSPELTQTLHDLGWMLLVMPFVPFTVLNVCLGTAILQDRSPVPVMPRWLGYFNLWTALSFMPGGAIPLFKTGPLAYDGLFAIWIPLFIFFAWWILMPVALHRAIVHCAAEDKAAMTAVRSG